MSSVANAKSLMELQCQAEKSLEDWPMPGLGVGLIESNSLKSLTSVGGRLELEIELGFPAELYAETLSRELENYLKMETPALAVDVQVSWKVRSAPKTPQSIRGVKQMIAIGSGKGGVGKSTTATNLALALAAEGARVGMLDADLYGPSQPRMLGISGLPETLDGKRLKPMMGHGLQTMSIGFLVDEEAPVIWRGPMITQALGRLLNETLWDDLDYLVVDLPPGTGDIHLTLAQRMPVSGAVIVTTPQDISLLDARKGLRMFEKVNVPVLGIVENMSTHICSCCGHEEHIFGQGGAQRMVEEYGCEMLGELPLDIRIRMGADDGQPVVVDEPEGAVARIYREMALRTAAQLAQQQSRSQIELPRIIIEDDD